MQDGQAHGDAAPDQFREREPPVLRQTTQDDLLIVRELHACLCFTLRGHGGPWKVAAEKAGPLPRVRHPHYSNAYLSFAP